LGLRQRMPWWAKMVVKIVLARLPVPYDVWSRVSVFRHGRMDEPKFAVDAVRTHCDVCAPPDRFTMLELGPGDTVASAVVAKALGASRSFLVDVGAFATADLTPYLGLAAFMRAAGLAPPPVERARSLAELLRSCDSVYMTGGMQSLRSLDSLSIDVCWSNAVLEHVRLSDVAPTLTELRRIVRGRMSHQIDLRDHVADSLNNLRFSQRIWESRLLAGSGFYTNRLRPSDWMRLFEDAGFRLVSVTAQRWSEAPIRRSALHREFREMPDDDLLVWGLHIVCE
jgi:hypothetical protein